MNHSKNILEADSITVSFGNRTVLHNAYIRVEQDEIVGLLGRNGCGKSTLLKSIFGIIEAEHITIRMNGVWMKYGHRRSKVMMLSQSDMIPGNIRMRQAMALFGVTTGAIETHLPNVIPFLDQSPVQLSGGERRAFELLLVLHSKSQFCMLDEPFTGLSPVMVEKMIGVMREVKKTKGILITDHLYRSVTSCSDRLYSFQKGGLREAKGRELNDLYESSSEA